MLSQLSNKMFVFRGGPWWDGDSTDGSTTTTDDKTTTATTDDKTSDKPADFEKWLVDQPEDVKSLYEKHIHGLKSALTKERTTADRVPGLEAKLREFEKNNTAASQTIETLTTKSAEATKKLDESTALVKDLKLEMAVVKGAAKLNFQDPGDAYNLVNKAELSFDDAGVVKGVTEALTKLSTEKKYLIRTGAGIGNNIDKSKSQDTTDTTQTQKSPPSLRL